MEVVADWVRQNAPPSAFVLDYMCGTGFLLNQVALSRPDIEVAGCSLTPTFIEYANRQYPRLAIVLQDALEYLPRRVPDVVTCTAGLHHLGRSSQPAFIRKVAGELQSGSYLLLGEEVIADYASEKERRLAALEMNSALIKHVIEAGAPEDVLLAATDVLNNDLIERGEYKSCRKTIEDLLRPYFCISEVCRLWPVEPSAFGDYLFICRRK